MDVDIIIDNFNYGRYLGAAVDSALAQRNANVRVIIVDDGSTDDSAAVIRGYGDAVTAVFKSNGGQASALNAGWAKARGDIVIFLDSDDVLLPDAAAHVVAAFETEPRLVKVQYRMRVIDELGRETGELKPPPHIRLPNGDLRTSELTFPFDLPWMATSGNAFSADALAQIMPIPETEFARSADWYLRHVITLFGDVRSLDDVCAYYRVHGANSYARGDDGLDLEHVRQSIRFASATHDQLLVAAARLGLSAPRIPILSVADLANRLISRKLDPQAHPRSSESPPGLAARGVLAAATRTDVRWPMRLMFIGWFMAMAVSPASMARTLAVAFLMPSRRRSLNPLLGRLSKAARDA